MGCRPRPETLWTALRAGALLLSVACAARVSALTCSIDGIDVRGIPQIKAYVTVMDAAGQTVKGLRADSFTVTDDILDHGPGPDVTPLTVNSAMDAGESLGVVLLIDRSGSMADGNALGSAKKAANEFLSRMSFADKVAVVSFSTDVREDCTATTDREAVNKALEGLAPKGDTALYDAAKKAAYVASKISGVTRKAVILLTDGRRTEGETSGDGTVQVAQDQGVRLFTIGLGPQPDHAALKTMADDTRGAHFRAATSGDLLRTYQTIADRLQNQYVAKFSREPDVRFHRLHLTVSYQGQSASDSLKYWPVVSGEAATDDVQDAEDGSGDDDDQKGEGGSGEDETDKAQLGDMPRWAMAALMAVLAAAVLLMAAIVVVVARRRRPAA